MRERPVESEIEPTRYHGPNVTRTTLDGAVLTLSTLEHLPDLE